MQDARGASLTGDAHPLRDRPRNRPRTGLVLGVAALALVVDVVTKVLAVQHLDDGRARDLVGSLLQLHLTRNPGAAFSTGTGVTPVITVFAMVALVVAVVVSRRVRTPAWGIALGLLIAGIGGNLIDRLLRDPGPLRGHVVDFLELPNWPIFNVADICINVAAGLIILQSLRGIPLAGRPDGTAPVAAPVTAPGNDDEVGT